MVQMHYFATKQGISTKVLEYTAVAFQQLAKKLKVGEHLLQLVQCFSEKQ